MDELYSLKGYTPTEHSNFSFPFHEPTIYWVKCARIILTDYFNVSPKNVKGSR